MALKNQVQLITYPDSLRGTLEALDQVLLGHFPGLFQGGVHILPPFPSRPSGGVPARVFPPAGRSVRPGGACASAGICDFGFPSSLEGPVKRGGGARGIPRSIVLAWLMSGVPPLIPLVAASSMGQLRENLDAGKIVLEAGCLRDLTDAAG
jgi:hypothetical protein